MADHELGDELGRGTFGVVWAARHRQLDRVVAVKQMVATNGTDEARFRREARLLAGLRHPHVVTVHDYREGDGQRALVMEALTGGTLEDRRASMSTEALVAVALAAASALDHVHRAGVLHRDVKPANVMFDADGRVRVTDFGVAGGASAGPDATMATLAGTFVGTPAYASPEQCAVAVGESWPEPSAASDQYALAATLFESLTGELPQDRAGGILALCHRKLTEPARPLASIRPGIGESIAAVVDRALARSPADRYPSVAAFGEALAAAAERDLGADWLARSGVEVVGDAAVPAPAADTAAAATAAPQRRAWLPAAIVATAAVVVVAGLVATDAFGADPGDLSDVTTTTPDGAGRPLTARWSVGTGASIFSSPAVAGAPGDELVVVGSDDGTIYAVDADAGGIAWTVATGGPVRSSPTVAGDVVVVGSNDGEVRSLRIADGTEVWRAPIGFEIVSSAAVAGDLVIVGADRLHALDLADGTTRWTAETGAIVSTPAIAGVLAVVGTEDGYVVGVAVDSGEIAWRLRTGDAIQSSPVIADDLAIVGGRDGNLYAVEHATGTLRWSADLGSPVKSSPAVVDGTVVVGTDAGEVVARRVDDGRGVWSHRTPDRVDSSPVVVGDVVVVGGNDHRVRSLAVDDGRVVGLFETEGPVLSSPAEIDGDVVVGSYDGRLYRVALR